jgi:hypothetical protein
VIWNIGVIKGKHTLNVGNAEHIVIGLKIYGE